MATLIPNLTNPILPVFTIDERVAEMLVESHQDDYRQGFENLGIANSSLDRHTLPLDFKMNGQAGNDRLSTGNGNDIIYGGSGEDKLVSFGGNDTLDGGSDDDYLWAGDDDDLLSGGSGNDEMYGGRGDDTLTGGTGDDILVGDRRFRARRAEGRLRQRRAHGRRLGRHSHRRRWGRQVRLPRGQFGSRRPRSHHRFQRRGRDRLLDARHSWRARHGDPCDLDRRAAKPKRCRLPALSTSSTTRRPVSKMGVALRVINAPVDADGLPVGLALTGGKPTTAAAAPAAAVKPMMTSRRLIRAPAYTKGYGSDDPMSPFAAWNCQKAPPT
jgi:hypothetical protein